MAQSPNTKKLGKKSDAEVVYRLTPARIKGAEFTRNVHVARVEVGVPREALLDPHYWMHVAAKMKAGDHIEVIPDDSSYYLELFVVAATKTSIKVQKINEVEFSENGSDVAESSNTDHPDYDIKWAGNVEKFQVVYKPDSKVLSSEHETKLEAAIWIDDYVKSLKK
jgi:hypothetical protein